MNEIVSNILLLFLYLLHIQISLNSINHPPKKYLIISLTLCLGTAGMLLVRPRCLDCGGSLELAAADPAGPAGLVGLGPAGLAPALKCCDVCDMAPGLNEGVRVGLRGDGDR